MALIRKLDLRGLQSRAPSLVVQLATSSKADWLGQISGAWHRSPESIKPIERTILAEVVLKQMERRHPLERTCFRGYRHHHPDPLKWRHMKARPQDAWFYVHVKLREPGLWLLVEPLRNVVKLLEDRHTEDLATVLLERMKKPRGSMGLLALSLLFSSVDEELREMCVRTMLTAMGETDNHVHVMAAQELARISRHLSQEQINKIWRGAVQNLSRHSGGVRASNILLLGALCHRVEPDAVEAVQTRLLQSLVHKDERIRRVSVQALFLVSRQRKGGEFRALIRTLIARLGDPSDAVRYHGIVLNVEKIRPLLEGAFLTEITQMVLGFLESKEWGIRRTAAMTLGGIGRLLDGHLLEDAVAMITARIGDKEFKVRRSAVSALNSMASRLRGKMNRDATGAVLELSRERQHP